MIENPLLLDLPMPIKTPRLTILPAQPQHAEKFFAAKEESLDILHPWMTWSKYSSSIAKEKEFLTQKYAQFILRQELMMLAFTHEGEFVVSTGLQKLNWEIGTAEIGYWCKKSARHNGYVTEAANAVARYGFDIVKLRKISIPMDSENTASERVPQRLNMQFEFEQIGGVATLHGGALRILRNYSCFNTDDLPPLDVSW